HGGAPCRMHCIEQSVAATWQWSFAVSRRCARRPICETTIRRWQSITARWLRLRTSAYWPTAISPSSHTSEPGKLEPCFALYVLSRQSSQRWRDNDEIEISRTYRRSSTASQSECSCRGANV